MNASRFLRRATLPLLLVFLTSCIDDVEQLGVGMLGHQAAAVYVPCGGVTEGSPPVVDLLLTEEDNNPGGDDDQVLWRAEPTDSTLRAFVTPFGTAPQGYETTIPLESELNPATEYTLYLHGGGGVMVFRPQDLERGQIESQGGRLTPQGFIDYDREGCGGDELASDAERLVLQLS